MRIKRKLNCDLFIYFVFSERVRPLQILFKQTLFRSPSNPLKRIPLADGGITLVRFLATIGRVETLIVETLFA